MACGLCWVSNSKGADTSSTSAVVAVALSRCAKYTTTASTASAHLSLLLLRQVAADRWELPETELLWRGNRPAAGLHTTPPHQPPYQRVYVSCRQTAAGAAVLRQAWLKIAAVSDRPGDTRRHTAAVEGGWCSRQSDVDNRVMASTWQPLQSVQRCHSLLTGTGCHGPLGWTAAGGKHALIAAVTVPLAAC
jgi:hypothetical protein